MSKSVAAARGIGLVKNELSRLTANWRPPPLPDYSAKPRVQPELPAAPAPSVIAVCSGKGGVGKSTVAVNLAAALAADGQRVGLLDADVYAPDIPLMVGLARSAPAQSWTLSRAGGRTRLEPVERYGMLLMSSGFIIAENQALSWAAELVETLLVQLIWGTEWGGLDYLIVDLPPGTSDVTQALFRLLPAAAAVAVVTPQDVAHLDTGRIVAVVRDASIRLLGGVENMSGLICPCCGTMIELFPRVAHERSIWSLGVRQLGAVPISAATGDAAYEPIVVRDPDSPRALALREVARQVRTLVEKETPPG